MPKFLVTGASSGLGKYLLAEYQGTPFCRDMIENEIRYHCREYYDAIIHCAADTRNTVPPKELLDYYRSNIELTQKLTQIPHNLFVFISSPAVYPNPFKINKENDIPTVHHMDPPIHQTYHLYGTFKLLGEQIVSHSTKKSIILRCVSIVGPTSRKSTNIMKVLINDPTPLTLSSKSSFSLVSMRQLKKFIDLSLSRDITGTFNVGSAQYVSLEEIAKAVGSNPKFGDFTHNVHKIDTSKIRRISNSFARETLDIAKETSIELMDGSC